MDSKKILAEQRMLTLKNHGIEIECKQSPNSLYDYLYTITDGKFSVYAYREKKDEVDTLSQVLTYLDSAPHKTALAESRAYQFCLDALDSYQIVADRLYSAKFDIKNKLRDSKKVDLEKELADLGIESISSLHCVNVIGLEDAKSKLAELYMNLAWLKQSAEQQGLDYDLSIFEAENGLQKI